MRTPLTAQRSGSSPPVAAAQRAPAGNRRCRTDLRQHEAQPSCARTSQEAGQHVVVDRDSKIAPRDHAPDGAQPAQHDHMHLGWQRGPRRVERQEIWTLAAVGTLSPIHTAATPCGVRVLDDREPHSAPDARSPCAPRGPPVSPDRSMCGCRVPPAVPRFHALAPAPAQPWAGRVVPESGRPLRLDVHRLQECRRQAD